MPYYVNQESPLAQIAGLASAYFRYKQMFQQQKLDNARTQQEMAATSAAMAHTQFEEGREKTSDTQNQAATLAERGIDPTTQKPFVEPPELTAPLPPNKGNYDTSLQNRLARDAAIRAWQRRTGQTGGASDTTADIGQIQKDIDYSRTTKQQDKLLLQRENFDVGQQGRSQGFQIGQQARSEQFTRDEAATRRDFEVTLKGIPTSQELWNRSAKQPSDALQAARTAQNQTSQFLSTGLAAMNGKNSAVLEAERKAGDTPDPSSVPNPNMAGFEQSLYKGLARIQAHPETAEGYIGQINKLGTLTDAQKGFAIDAVRRTAAWAKAARAAQKMLNSTNSGGSNANGDPQYPGP